MVKQVTERSGVTPAHGLVDGGYPAHEQLDRVAEHTTVYAPVPKPKDPATDPYVPKAGYSEAVAAWRVRMGTEAAKKLCTKSGRRQPNVSMPWRESAG